MRPPWPKAVTPPTLSNDEAHLWAVPIDESSALCERGLAHLSNEERQRADQFQLDAPRRRFIGARAALRQLLGEYLGVPAADVMVIYGLHGKPQLHEAGRSESLHFNLAHTKDLALVAVTRGCDVGVDVERLRLVSHFESIARRYFHPLEVADIFAAPQARRQEAFLRYWTAKEAVLKAVGTGLTDSLAAFCVPIGAAAGAWLEVPARGDVNPLRCWLRQLTPCHGTIGAVAFVGEKRRVTCLSLSLGDQ
jgi:4'-phosphopantetheinyl transferase